MPSSFMFQMASFSPLKVLKTRRWPSGVREGLTSTMLRGAFGQRDEAAAVGVHDRELG